MFGKKRQRQRIRRKEIVIPYTVVHHPISIGGHLHAVGPGADMDMFRVVNIQREPCGCCAIAVCTVDSAQVPSYVGVPVKAHKV